MRQMRHLTSSVLALVLGAAGIVAAEQPQVDPAADMLLKRMGAVLGAAEEFTVTNTFTSDETVSTGGIVQLEGTVEIALSRPDGLRAAISGDFGPKQYFYDGERMVFADSLHNTWAEATVPATIDEAMETMWTIYGVKIPELPDDTQDVKVGDSNYYYMGTFYTQNDKGFTVVTAPPGATVSYVPEGYTTHAINGTIYYEYGGVDYQPKMVDGGTAYVVANV